MKPLTRFAAAALLALSASVPAFAYDFESQTLAERNTYIHTPDGRMHGAKARHATRGTDAFAREQPSDQINDPVKSPISDLN